MTGVLFAKLLSISNNEDIWHGWTIWNREQFSYQDEAQHSNTIITEALEDLLKD
jgi:hypothetical protein